MVSFLNLVVLLGIAAQVFGLICMFRFYLKRNPPPLQDNGGPLPGVSIIKTCYSCDDNEKENFDTFFRQNYLGPIQMLFMVSNETDPIVPVIRDYLKRYPKFDAQLVISNTRNACRLKFDALFDGYHEAKYEFVIWSDSDVIVQENYVSQMVACLQESGVSVVTSPQYDIRVNNISTAFKVLGNNCDVATYVMAFDAMVDRREAVWGHSVGFKKSEFDEFGEEAWQLLNRSLADDIWLPYVFAKRGKKIVYRNIDCPVQYSNKTFQQVIDQKERFVLCQKAVIGNRFVYLMGLLAYPQIPAAVLMIADFNSWSVGLFFAVAFVRIFSSFCFELLFAKTLTTWVRYFWTIIFWDLSQVYFIIFGFFTDSICFHGKTYRIVDRYFLESTPTQA